MLLTSQFSSSVFWVTSELWHSCSSVGNGLTLRCLSELVSKQESYC